MLSLILGLTGPPAVVLVMCLAGKHSADTLNSYVVPYAVGFVAALFCVYIVPLRHCPSNPFLGQIVERREAANKRYQLRTSDLDDDFGMEHLWFNANLEPQTLWVNLGFWKNTQTASKACDDLFQEVLNTSGISQAAEFSIIEVGSACAETAFSLMKRYPESCTKWTGLTLSNLQAHVASQRLSTAAQMSKSPDGQLKFQSFHADASNPSSWSADILQRLSQSSRPWLVALDVLVHFEPSRESTIAHMKREYNASFAVTDVIRKDDLTWIDKLKLHISMKLLDTPSKNVLTRSEYIQMLVNCGYNKSDIVIVPITEYVYRPYSDFIVEQGRRWQDLGGGKWDYNDFWLVGSVFKFWADTGLVDSCIIVARA